MGVGYEEEKFLNEYRRTLYMSTKLRLGVDGSVDFDAWKFGRERDTVVDGNVEEESLPDGSVEEWRVGPTLTLQQKRWSGSISGKIGQATPEADDKLRTLISPGAEVSFVLYYFEDLVGGAPEKFGKDGKMPPRVSLGLKGIADVALEKPEFQKSQFNEVEAMLFTDFVVSDNLSFRVGIPLEGALVEQEAAQATDGTDVPKRTDLQWTVPVTIVTAVSL